MLVRPDDRFTGSPAPAARSLTSSQFWAEFMRSAVWFGNGFMIAEEDADGGPVAGTCRILHPDMVSPQYDSDTGLVYRRIGEQSGGSYVDTDETGRCLLGGRVYRLIQLRHPHSPIDELGMAKGTLEMYRAELQLAGQAVSYGSSMYRSGIPAGYLKTTLPNFTKEQSDRLKAQWMDYHGGDERSIGVLNATTDWHSIQMSPLDMALIQMMQWNLVSISNAFGVPAFYLGHDATSSNTYSNAESRNSDLRQSLMPWAVVFEELLTAQFPANSWVEIDWRGLLRPDAAQRYSAYSTAIKDGWLTPDEVRAIESLPPLPEQGYLGVDPRLGQNTTTEEVPADGAVG
jgi:HK97 family phage portal protein